MAKLKISKGIAILTKLRTFVSRENLRMLFFTFIQLHIYYGLLIWGGATASNLKPMQSKLKEAIRKMSFKKTDTWQNHCSSNIKS